MSTEVWGRIALAGGTDWPNIGRPGRPANDLRQDQPSPSVIRSCLTTKFKRVFTSPCSVHAVLLDIDNKPWLVGRNEHNACGSPKDAIWEPTPLSNTEVFPGTPQELLKDTIVHAATGRHHTILVTASGAAFVTGQNHLGQAAQPGLRDVERFSRVDVNGDKVVAASAGVTFSLFLTDKGQVWAVGGAEKGQLGHGKTGETIANSRVIIQDEPHPLLVKGLEGKHIVAIASGHQHSLAMDKEGYVWSWGHGGLGRLGHGEQKDCLAPRLVDAFTSDNRIMRATKIACGATCSMVIDGQRMLQVFGKFKVTGDGSAGQPWMTPKPFHELASYKMKLVAGGATTLFAVTDDLEDFNVIGLGQGTNHGELGLGSDKAKSASKMTPIDMLKDIDVVDLGAGQNTTWFIVRPPATPSEKAAAAAAAPPVQKPKQVENGYDSGWGFASPAPPSPAEEEPAKPAEDAPAEKSEGDQKQPKAPTGPPVSKTEGDAWDNFGRFPEELEEPAPAECYVCGQEDDDTAADVPPSIICDRCESSVHLHCLDPPTKEVPEGEFFCQKCLAGPTEVAATASHKRKASEGGAAPAKKRR